MTTAKQDSEKARRPQEISGAIRQQAGWLIKASHDRCDCDENAMLIVELLDELDSVLTVDMLRASRLLVALKAVMAGFDEGVWVRSRTIKIMKRVQALRMAAGIIAEIEGRQE